MECNPEKEVYFDQYCSKCVFKNTLEKDDPCDECLATPVNTYSHKPIKFVEGNTK